MCHIKRIWSGFSFRINDRTAQVIARQLAVIGDQLDREWTSRRPNWLPTPLHILRPAQALTRTIYRYKIRKKTPRSLQLLCVWHVVLFQGHPQSVMGLPGPVCCSEGLDSEHCAWAGDPQSWGLDSLGNTRSLWYYVSQLTFSYYYLVENMI